MKKRKLNFMSLVIFLIIAGFVFYGSPLEISLQAEESVKSTVPEISAPSKEVTTEKVEEETETKDSAEEESEEEVAEEDSDEEIPEEDSEEEATDEEISEGEAEAAEEEEEEVAAGGMDSSKTDAVELTSEMPQTAVSDAVAGMTDALSTTVSKQETNQEKKANIENQKEAPSQLSIWNLIQSGGVLMIPIGFMSVLVVMVGLERLFALRSGVVLPRKLMRDVDAQIKAKATPQSIYLLTRQSNSTLSKVIQSALYKAGRPMSEVQEAIEQAKENEANRLYAWVRPLVLAAAVTPLIGLLGTVIGMIQAFMATASSMDIHKAEMLSEGIYLALITTCAGLIVAIPAAILAHWYEGKIQRLFYKLDSQLVNFISYMETLEGKVHISPAAYKAFTKQKSGK